MKMSCFSKTLLLLHLSHFRACVEYSGLGVDAIQARWKSCLPAVQVSKGILPHPKEMTVAKNCHSWPRGQCIWRSGRCARLLSPFSQKSKSMAPPRYVHTRVHQGAAVSQRSSPSGFHQPVGYEMHVWGYVCDPRLPAWRQAVAEGGPQAGPMFPSIRTRLLVFRRADT
jgi:hypothetical protein